MSKTVLLGPLQVDHPAIFEAKDFDGNAQFKYSVMCIIPKSDKETVKKIHAALNDTLKDTGWNAAAKKQALGVATTMSQENNFSVIRDGDITNEARAAANKPETEHIKNCFTFKLSRKQSFERPYVVRVNPETHKADIKVPISEMEGLIRRGTYCYVAFNCWTNDKKGFSINTTLQGVVFYKQPLNAAGEPEFFGDGNPFGDEEFEFVPEPAPPELGENPFPDTETDEV